MVLMACCDAHYRFTLLSIGSAGKESDGGIFQSTAFGQCIIRDRLPLPDDEVFNNFHMPLSAVFVGKKALANRSKHFIFSLAENKRNIVTLFYYKGTCALWRLTSLYVYSLIYAIRFFLISGDAAFPLLKNLMRPYGGANLPPDQTILNYRLSRARRVVENAFGILASRFRVFRKPIYASETTVEKIIKASSALHNWLRTLDIESRTGLQNYMVPDLVDREENGILRPGQWRNEGAPNG